MSKKLSTQFENNRQSILEITSKLFCDKGINATSFSDISKAVKLSKGTIYYYYPSKDHLIYEVTEYHLGRVTDSIFAWIESINENTSIEDALTCLVQSVFDTDDKCRLHICLINYSIMGNDVIKNIIKEKTAKWHTMVEVGLVKTGCSASKQITDAVFITLDSIIIKRVMGIMDIKEKDICAYMSKCL
ncbi:MAG: TetR/AcrR family transcriptional regulator [Eubacteriales bacterium]|nr:TetR/AcrR family transcriptional regulator [Eubacteriales bacterium]